MSAKEKFKLSPFVNEFVPRCYKQSVVENDPFYEGDSSAPATTTSDKINKQTLCKDGTTEQQFYNFVMKDGARNSDYKTKKIAQFSLPTQEKERYKKEPSSSSYERRDWSESKEKPQRAFNNLRSFDKNDYQAAGSSAKSSFDSPQFRRSLVIPNVGKNVIKVPKPRAHVIESSSSFNVGGDDDGSNSKWIEVKSTKDKRHRSQNFEFGDHANSRSDNQTASLSKQTANIRINNKDKGVLKQPALTSADKDSINSNKGVVNNNTDFGNTLDGAKKKKKTSAQRRQEYQKKLQGLPSTQGKVVTVTSDVFHFINTGERVSIKSRKRNDENLELGRENFPVLGNNSSITKNVVNEDDSCWSDIETIENTQKCENIVHSVNKYQKMEDYPELCALNSKKTFNLSKKPNYSELFKKVAMNQSSSETLINDFVERKDNSLTKIRKDVKSVPQVQNNVSSKPKSNSLIKLDIFNMIHVKKENGKSKHSANIKEKKMVKIKPVVANILDSSAPTRRRGKEREIPKKKKPTTLKKIILKERLDRKLTRKKISAQVVAPEESVESIEEAITETHSEIIHPENILKLENEDAESSQHSRKFREYCSQKLSPEIDAVATKLIQDLIRFHDRVYQKDPVKAKMRRRMVVGLKEITKHLKLKRIKCLILAPNLERISNQGGLDDVMSSILSLAEENNVPVVFALGRRKLGRVCLKKVPVSGIGIFNYDGSEVNFKKLVELVIDEKKSYSNEFGKSTNDLTTS